MSDPSKVNILVVDDEPGIRDLLSFELGSKGYHVVTASDGLDALDHIKKERFQVIISDLMMPNMDGMKLLEETKKLDPGAEVITMTGYGTVEAAVNAIRKGAYDFIQKPFNIDEMFALIEKAMEKSELKTLVGLYEASKTLHSTVDMKEILEKIMELIVRVLNADEGSIMLIDADEKLYIAASRGIREDVVRDTRIAPGDGIAGTVARNREPMLLIDGLEQYPQFQDIKPNKKIRSSIICPLICQNELTGVLNLNRTSTKLNFTESDLKNATIFAFQAAQAIQNANLYQKLARKVSELESVNLNLTETQAQLVHAEKSILVDQLAVGIAHEVNNPLAILLQGVDCLSRSLKNQNPEVIQLVQDMRSAVQKAALIIRALMDLASSDQPNLVPVNLDDVIHESLTLVQNDLDKHGIRVIKHFETGLPKANLDRGKMVQALAHLYNNAIHAMPGGGELTVKTYPAGEKVPSGGTFAVEVQDTGKGIPVNLGSTVFDPFVTTKRSEGGIGLGLSTVKSFVEAHNGTIKFSDRAPDSGTRIIMTLPFIPKSKDKQSVKGNAS